jgi:hypothetical protein
MSVKHENFRSETESILLQNLKKKIEETINKYNILKLISNVKYNGRGITLPQLYEYIEKNDTYIASLPVGDEYVIEIQIYGRQESDDIPSTVIIVEARSKNEFMILVHSSLSPQIRD